MDDLNKFIDMVITAIDTRQNKKAKPRTVQAKVLRVDPDGTVWVNVPGGAPETPCVASTASCRRGDLVQCQISNGKGTVIGNMTRKATDDEKAIQADEKASAAGTLAEEAQTTAEEANELAYDTAQHLWTKETGGTPDCPTGTYVTEVPQKEYDPEKGGTPTGGNVLIRSAGLFIRLAGRTLAEFTGSHIQFRDEDGNVVSSFGKVVELLSGDYNLSLSGTDGLTLDYGNDGFLLGRMSMYARYEANKFLGILDSQDKLIIMATNPSELGAVARIELTGDGRTINLYRDVSVDRDLNVTRRLTAGNIVCGSVTLTTTPNTRVSATVTFGSSTTFSGVPHVVATPVSTAPDNIKGCTVASVSSTGFTIWLCRTDSSTTVVHWIAME